VRLVDVDLEAACAAYAAKDEKAFAMAVAPLGVELDIATLRRAISFHAKNCAIALDALYRAIVDEAGVGTARNDEIGEHYVAMAVRLDDRVVFGARWWSHQHRYGWEEIRRWYKDTARNREHMVAWATSKKPPIATVTAKLVAPPAVAADRDGDALRAAVLAAPDDDGARLVYADWLLEQNDPRGELIQLECALSARPGDEALAERAEQVRARCAAAFDKLVDGAPYTTRRGFLDEVTLTVAAYSKRGAALLAAQPIDRLVISIADQKQLVKLAGLAIPKRLGLRLAGDPKHSTALNVGVKGIAPIFEGRARVGFERIAATTKQWAALLGSPACAKLRDLELHSRLDADIVAVLADRELDLLDIKGPYFGDAISKSQLAALRRLGARVRRLGGLGWKGEGRFQTMFAALLADSSFEELDYSTTHFGRVIVELLAKSERSRSLRGLAIRAFEPPVLERILTSPNLAGLEELRLHWGLDDEHIPAYVELVRGTKLKIRWRQAPAEVRAAAPQAFA
jgi:uncharacterized protein (TIGR02996 family)